MNSTLGCQISKGRVPPCLANLFQKKLATSGPQIQDNIRKLSLRQKGSFPLLKMCMDTNQDLKDPTSSYLSFTFIVQLSNTSHEQNFL